MLQAEAEGANVSLKYPHKHPYQCVFYHFIHGNSTDKHLEPEIPWLTLRCSIKKKMTLGLHNTGYQTQVS